MSEQMQAWGAQDRYLSARESYREVLDATKHQDDKIGRFLTAIAFLFTGAVALASRTKLVDGTVSVDDSPRYLALICLGIFLGLAVLSVLLLVIAIGPNLALPHPGASGLRSRLFFLAIAGYSPTHWNNRWTLGPGREEMLQMYVREAHNLAGKTDFKYSRTNEARALFTLGLLFLALSIVLAFLSVGRFGPSSSATLPWDSLTRNIVGTTLATFAFFLAYDYMRLDQALGNYEDERRWFRVVPMYFLPAAAVAYVLAMLMPAAVPGSRWPLAVAITAAVLAGLIIGLRAQRSRSPWSWIWRGLSLSLAVSLMLAAMAALHSTNFWWRILLGLSIVLLLELPRVLVSTYWLFRRRHAAPVGGR
jgi:Pycsar effector protein